MRMNRWMLIKDLKPYKNTILCTYTVCVSNISQSTLYWTNCFHSSLPEIPIDILNRGFRFFSGKAYFNFPAFQLSFISIIIIFLSQPNLFFLQTILHSTTQQVQDHKDTKHKFTEISKSGNNDYQNISCVLRYKAL